MWIDSPGWSSVYQMMVGHGFVKCIEGISSYGIFFSDSVAIRTELLSTVRENGRIVLKACSEQPKDDSGASTSFNPPGTIL